MESSPAYLEPTTIGAYTEAIIRALESYEVDPLDVIREADVDRVRSNDPLLRISDSSVNAIFGRAVAATGDPLFGLRVADSILPGMLHALGFALMASDTLEDFCQRLVRYYSVVSQSAQLSVEVTGEEFRFAGVPKSRKLCVETQDAWAGMITRLMRGVYHEELRPLRLELLRPVPACGPQAFIDYFGCPVDFDMDRICFHFDLEVMRQPLLGASPELAQHNDHILMGYLERLDRDDIVNRVRTHLIEGLSRGSFSRDIVATRMNMSASSLQVKLARRGASFQQILDGTRHELAMAYICQSRMSVTEIAFMLGFSDVSNFNRAFRRWTGKAPSSFRSDQEPPAN